MGRFYYDASRQPALDGPWGPAKHSRLLALGRPVFFSALVCAACLAACLAACRSPGPALSPGSSSPGANLPEASPFPSPGPSSMAEPSLDPGPRPSPQATTGPLSTPGADPSLAPPPKALKPMHFSESWGYLLSGDEASLKPGMPISDVGYFGAGLNSSIELTGLPKRSNLANYKGRVHLVVAEVSNYTNAHFALSPEYPMRERLIKSLVGAAAEYDGLQIDFETVPGRDAMNFLSFLSELKALLGDKCLSVALPARLKDMDSPFEYRPIAAIVDRIIIMAYDEHWSGSRPGSVSSLDWGRRVASYALTRIPHEKLVMGAPFYGRAWGDKRVSLAYKYPSVMELIKKKGVKNVKRVNEIPYFSYRESVFVEVYYEDLRSAMARLKGYGRLSVHKVAFWRLGMEDPRVWSNFVLEKQINANDSQ